jgi:hypothetical protein
MTVKIRFADGTEMLFGDSYRTWQDQLSEYCREFRQAPSKAWKCPAPWPSFGGLKWCTPQAVTAALKEEGKGRTVANFADWSEFDIAPVTRAERAI